MPAGDWLPELIDRILDEIKQVSDSQKKSDDRVNERISNIEQTLIAISGKLSDMQLAQSKEVNAYNLRTSIDLTEIKTKLGIMCIGISLVTAGIISWFFRR
jgi:hypothetical protein